MSEHTISILVLLSFGEQKTNLETEQDSFVERTC
jgi:hypothetical protein